jgi:hypothetical protein
MNASLSGEVKCGLFSPYPEEKEDVCRMIRNFTNYMQRNTNKTRLDISQKLQICMVSKLQTIYGAIKMT